MAIADITDRAENQATAVMCVCKMLSPDDVPSISLYFCPDTWS